MTAQMPVEAKTRASVGHQERPTDVVVWDVFVRLFHWSLVVSFAVAWYTGGIWDTPHLVSSYFVLALVIARIVWGFIGSTHARFTDFLFSPITTLRYLSDMMRLRAPRFLGHNPAGAIMILALITTLLVLCISGVLMTTSAFWGIEWIDTLHNAASTSALLLVGLHVVGVVFSSFEHKENLVKSMITGRKQALSSSDR